MSDSDIVTRCPQCNTAFRVTPNQLAVADGVVRCGSCLAVFEAIDHVTADSAKAKNQTDNTDDGNNMEINDDALIKDEEEAGLELEEDIYDLDTNNKNKKTSLFDRKLKPISQHSRESADESWALDMLADLEDDDDIEPIKIKRPSKDKSSEPDPQANTPTSNQSAETKPLDNKEEPAFSSKTIKLKEPSVAKDEEETRGVFSFFKRKKTKHTETAELDELAFDYDETYNETTNDDFAEDLSSGNQADSFNYDNSVDKIKHEEQQADTDNLEAIYFEDEHTENTSEELAFDTEAIEDAYEPQSSSQISDEEIEDAMHSRTSYAREKSDYLSSIQPAPVEMEWYESGRTQLWLWAIGGLLLALILLVQIAIFRFDTLSKNLVYRPYYETACQVIGCQLPELIDTQKIRTTNLVVRSHPNKGQVLIIDAILINSANFSQPYPALKLEFSDLNNRLIASRDLQPGEYLRGELSGATQMPSNQPVQLSLAIVDPGDTAVNYQLKVVKAKVRP